MRNNDVFFCIASKWLLETSTCKAARDGAIGIRVHDTDDTAVEASDQDNETHDHTGNIYECKKGVLFARKEAALSYDKEP
jgi:hypothetical protein